MGNAKSILKMLTPAQAKILALPSAATLAAVLTGLDAQRRKMLVYKVASASDKVPAPQTKKQRALKAYKYVGPSFASALTGAGVGAALSRKGFRFSNAKKGLLIGGANALLWRLLTRGKPVGAEPIK